MPEQAQMTPQKARRWLLVFNGAVILLLLGLICLVIYALLHPVRRMALLIMLATLLCPLFLAWLVGRVGLTGLFDPESVIDPTSVKSALRQHPAIFLIFPMVISAVVWGFLLMKLGMKEGGDQKAWVKNHTVLVVLWVMTPQVALAYLLVSLHATYLGIYFASCVVYAAITVPVGGITLEKGVVRFFGTYKAQASPFVILSFALLCAVSFGILHFAVWSMWPGEYLNMHGIEDAMYFSVVTMATVGYGDILPVGHLARGLCISEILAGVLLLVVGVSAAMAIWLQTNQPGLRESPASTPDPFAQKANEDLDSTTPADR